jgi:hypothetical protein
MGDLKAIGSEKLTGQDKLKRIMEIARFNEVMPTNINETARSEYSIPLADGNKYEIVKERQGYIIKKTISESESDYIEPMKNRKYYSSYSQALKRLNLVAGELNRLNENNEEVSLYGEQKKFTLKTPKPSIESMPSSEIPASPPSVPSPSLPPSPNSSIPSEDGMGDMDMDMDTDTGMDMGMDMGMEDMGPEGEDDMDISMDVETSRTGEEEKVTFKTIQKLTGKLTQKIRTLNTQEGITSEDIKYVINMVLSSLDLKSLSEEDKEDILSKFDEESEDLGGDDMDGLDLTDDSEVEDIQSDMDIPIEREMEEGGYGNGAIFDSIFGESKVDKVISNYFEITKKEINENKEKNSQKKMRIVSEVRKQMKEVARLSETIEQEFLSKKFLDKNPSAKIVGVTNRKNLVFENKGKQVKISPEGLLI